MSCSTDFPARGKVIRVTADSIVFAPANTTYELKLLTTGAYDGPTQSLIDATIRASVRKLWTVASGGNFVTPIQGPPRIIQGRVKYLDSRMMVVQAGTLITVDLPSADTSFDLNHGQLAVGALVNCTLLPGATFKLTAPVAAAT